MQELLLTSQVVRHNLRPCTFYFCARLNSRDNILIGSGKTDNFTQKYNFQ